MKPGDSVLFVLVATGQKVANYPPLLQFAKRGDDTLWLISEGAKGWFTETDEAFLKGKGLSVEKIDVEDLYFPRAIRDAVIEKSSFFKDGGDHPGKVFFILNGGQKLTPIGLYAAGGALSERRIEVNYLHGDFPGCKFRLYKQLDQDAAPKEETYTPERMLDLASIVELNGRKLNDPEFTWSYRQGLEPCCFKPIEINEFLNKRKQFHELIENKKKLAKLGKDVDEEVKRKIVELSNEVGTEFELLVFNRMISFFEKNREKYKSIIKEVVCQAKFSTSATDESDFDVGVVLLNGTVLNFECKSGSFKRKDLESRISLLRKSTSNIASLILVAPLLFRDSKEPIEEEIDRIKRRDLWQIDVIPYTLPGYDPSKLEGILDHPPGDFESELAKRLEKFLP